MRTLTEFDKWVKPFLIQHDWEWDFFLNYVVPSKNGRTRVRNRIEACLRYKVSPTTLKLVRRRIEKLEFEWSKNEYKEENTKFPIEIGFGL